MLPASLAAKWLPREFVESTRIGGALTVVAYLTMLVLFIVQLWDFLKRSTRSSLLLDFNAGTQVQINFDIDMLDIECRNLRVVVMDELREEPIRQLAKEYTLHTLDNTGQQKHKGLHSRKVGPDSEQDDEWARHKRRQGELETGDGKSELDSDWASSHDGFKHKSFEHVIEFHDFTLINFFAEWCVHCRHFAPKWNEIAAKVNDHKKFVDKDGQPLQVKALKMNCVDFKDLCREQGIDAFPTIRLFKSDGTFSIFEGDRNEGAIIRWIELMVRTKYSLKSSPEEFETGCNVKGFTRVPRVPGHLELMAGGGDQNLEPSMTNVSHRVWHLEFCVPDPGRPHAGAEACGAGASGGMASILTPHNAPLDGKSYTTSAYHQVYEHHLRLVTTMRKVGIFGRGTSYQFSHYGRTAKVNDSEVPQARFYFDFEPFALLEDREQKQWYQFATSLFAILGGVFVMMRLCAMTSICVASTVERSATPARARKNGLLT